MDETQKRKVSAKEFLQKNRKVGYGILGIFLSLFIIYFAFVYFYSHQIQTADQVLATSTDSTSSFIGDLLPVFTESPNPNLDPSFLGNFASNTSNIVDGGDGTQAGDNSKLLQIENKPVLGYVVFDKPISIKSYILNKPKICSEKLAVVTTKEEKSPSVLSFQNMLRSMTDYSDTPDTGILDSATRDKIYIFQTRYADILYKNKASKTPTRTIDKETVHFLNLLCGFEKENSDDYVQIPTLRYVTKADRQIYDYNTETKEKTPIEAKTATGTEEVTFSKDGNFVVYRNDSNGEINSIFYDIRIQSVTHLEANITALDFTNKDQLIYGVPGQDGMTIKVYDHLSNSVSKIASLPLNEWNLDSIGDNQIGISSKPSAFAEGIFMLLDTSTKKLRQLAGPLVGLSLQKTNLPDYTILSTGGQGVTKTLLLNNTTRNIGDFGISTFAEKCAQTIFANGVFCAVPQNLSKNYIYPDDWYKGKMSTQDVIMFKTLNGTTTKVISYLENKPISIINLNVNKNGIFFMDENTLQLYSLGLN